MKPTIPLLSLALFAGPALAGELPSIDKPLRTGSKAPADAGVVIGIEDYVRKGVPDVPYAARDAQAFSDFLISTRGVPTDRVQLIDQNANATKIRLAVAALGQSVGEGGVAWVYFAGHGGASLNGGARMLLGDDVTQDPESFDAGGVLVSEIEALAGAGGGRVVVVVDACYTGTGRDGSAFLTGKRAVVPGGYTAQKPKSNVVWTAASAGQTSGPLDGAQHGAFTYFALGGLRGWADGGIDGVRDGRVTMDEAQTYVQRTLKSSQLTSQTPEVIGARDLVLSERVTEVAPELSPSPSPATGAKVPRTEVAVLVPKTGEARIRTDGKELDFEALAAEAQLAAADAEREREKSEREEAERQRRAEAEEAERVEAARKAAVALAEAEERARKLQEELERRLAAERRKKMDAAAIELRADATRDYAAIAALVREPTPQGTPVLKAWLARYGSATVSVDDETEDVDIPEEGAVRAAVRRIEAADVSAALSEAGGSTARVEPHRRGVDLMARHYDVLELRLIQTWATGGTADFSTFFPTDDDEELTDTQQATEDAWSDVTPTISEMGEIPTTVLAMEAGGGWGIARAGMYLGFGGTGGESRSFEGSNGTLTYSPSWTWAIGARGGLFLP